VFSYAPIQQKSCKEPSYIYPGSSSTSTIPGSAYDDCLMPSFLHQYNSYQPVETPQTVPVLSTSLPLAQGNFSVHLDTRRSRWHNRMLGGPKIGWNPRTHESRMRVADKSARITERWETRNIRKPVLASKVVNPFTRALAPPFYRETKGILHSEITLGSKEYS
jgi:hypothetical protein